jgi:hypothetical protein
MNARPPAIADGPNACAAPQGQTRTRRRQTAHPSATARSLVGRSDARPLSTSHHLTYRGCDPAVTLLRSPLPDEYLQRAGRVAPASGARRTRAGSAVHRNRRRPGARCRDGGLRFSLCSTRLGHCRGLAGRDVAMGQPEKSRSGRHTAEASSQPRLGCPAQRSTRWSAPVPVGLGVLAS